MNGCQDRSIEKALSARRNCRDAQIDRITAILGAEPGLCVEVHSLDVDLANESLDQHGTVIDQESQALASGQPNTGNGFA